MRFTKALEKETELLEQWSKHNDQNGSQEQQTVGMELELWLVDDHGRPACTSEELLRRLKNPNVTHELGKFQVEYNSPVYNLMDKVFSRMYSDLLQFYEGLKVLANEEFQAHPLTIGTLPTLEQEDMSLENMCDCHRYRALNEQFLRSRHGKKVEIHIEGNQNPAEETNILHLEHPNVMMEACCSSFQLHWQMPFSKSAKYYNAALIASPIVLAATANSPYLFGKNLWAETRIPMVEQSCAFGGELAPRVWFASDFCRDNLVELFRENIGRVVVIPVPMDDKDTRAMEHLRVHNGTLWRWLRPVVDVDEKHNPHVRMEHRSLPSGPTLLDTVANAALYYGLVQHLVDLDVSAEERIRFRHVRNNFYSSAKNGLHAEIVWLDNEKGTIEELLTRELLDAARSGLKSLGIAQTDIDEFMGIIELRVWTGQTGAVWQERWVDKYGWNLKAMTTAYRRNQDTGRVVAEWNV